ncbi:MAG: helix-turn-helix transcriptional regulator [Lachnospiraceae bacterium]|nr:helix-turn-helix transcriptional regulator [Lachnospiraceae bacterium]
MKNQNYLTKREQWRAMIRQRDDRSEIVNYDDPSFPSYSFVGHMDGSSPWIRKVHWHEDVELMTVLNGKMAYNINGSLIEVNAGDTIFINSRQLHFSTDVDNTYCTYIITVIHPRLLISSPEVESEYVLPVITDPDLQYILFKKGDEDTKKINYLTDELNKAAGNQFEITRSFFGIWHYVLLRAGENLSELNEINYERIESLKNMIGFIKENYDEKLTLEEIAASGNLSKSGCNNIFKKYTGHSPNEYLIRYRLDKAMELLAGTDDSVGNISSRCGFNSSSYMTEQFVRCYRLTPREFRKNKRN